MRYYIKEVAACNFCPHMLHLSNFGKACAKTGKTLRGYDIPSSCPLPGKRRMGKALREGKA